LRKGLRQIQKLSVALKAKTESIRHNHHRDSVLAIVAGCRPIRELRVTCTPSAVVSRRIQKR
jgi:hypothetical protein